MGEDRKIFNLQKTSRNGCSKSMETVVEHILKQLFNRIGTVVSIGMERLFQMRWNECDNGCCYPATTAIVEVFGGLSASGMDGE